MQNLALSGKLIDLFQSCNDAEGVWVLLLALFTEEEVSEVRPSTLDEYLPYVAERVEAVLQRSSPEEVVGVLKKHWKEMEEPGTPEIDVVKTLLLFLSLPESVDGAISEYARVLATKVVEGASLQSDLEDLVEDVYFIPGMKEALTSRWIQLAGSLDDLQELMETGEEEYWLP